MVIQSQSSSVNGNISQAQNPSMASNKLVSFFQFLDSPPPGQFMRESEKRKNNYVSPDADHRTKRPRINDDQDNKRMETTEEIEFLEKVADEIRRAPIDLELSLAVHPSSSRSYKKPIDSEEVKKNRILGGNDPWVIKKKLNNGDVGYLCRILLTVDSVRVIREHIFPFLSQDERSKIEAGDGVQFTTFDVETRTEHQLTLKRLKPLGNYILNGNWRSDFVRRRELKSEDEIGMYWDSLVSKFNFCVLKRGPGHQPPLAAAVTPKKPRKKVRFKI